MQLKYINFYSKRFLLLLILAIVIYGVCGYFFVRYLFKPGTGLVEYYPEFILSDGKILFAPKTPFSPAVKAGLLPNVDILLKIQEKPVMNLRNIVDYDLEIKSFNSFPVRVLRDGQEMDIYIKPVFILTRPDWFLILLFAVVLAFFAFHLIINNLNDPSSFYLILACLFYMVFTCVKPFYYENLFSNSLIHLGKVTSWLLVFFAIYFIKPLGTAANRRSLFILLAALYAAFILYRLFLFQAWSITGTDQFYNSYKFWGQINNIADGIAYLVVFFSTAYKYLRITSCEDKKKLEWFICGSIIALVPYFILEQIPIILSDVLGLRASIGALANFFLLALPLFLFIGLVKKKVVKIKYFLLHYAVHFILALVLLAFFTLAYNPLFLFLKEYFILDNTNLSLLTTFPFFIILFLLRFIFSGLFKRYFYLRYSTLPFHPSNVFLVEKIKELNYTIEKLTIDRQSEIQQATDRELRIFIKGLTTWLTQSCQEVTHNLLELDRTLDTLSLFVDLKELSAQPNITQTLDSSMANLFINNRQTQNVITVLEEKLDSKPALSMNVNFSLIIKKAISEMKHIIPEIQIVSKLECEKYINIVPCDIEQVVTNILQNAYEADKYAVINVFTYSENNYCILEVEDNGPGITVNPASKVFLPFFTTKSEHLGLGLYISKILIEKHNGQIEIANSEVRGSRFKMHFPLPY